MKKSGDHITPCKAIRSRNNYEEILLQKSCDRYTTFVTQLFVLVVGNHTIICTGGG